MHTRIIPALTASLCLLYIGIADAAPVDSGRIYLYNRQYEAAEAYYERALEANPLSVALHRYYQDSFFGRGEEAQAAVAQHYKALAEREPDNKLYRYLYARCLPCSLAHEQFEKTLHIDKCNALARNARGACFFEQGEFGRAKNEFIRAIRCNPDFREAYQNLAAVYSEQDHIRRAKKVYRKLIGRERKNAQSYEWLGNMYLGRREYDYARMAYEKSVRFGATGPEIFFKLGYTRFQLGKFRHAINAYRKSIRQGNNTFEVYYNLANALEQFGIYDEAITQYENARARKVDSTIFYSIGNCAVMMGLYSKAIENYEIYLEARPGHTEALFGLANAYQMKKNFDRAISLYEKIIAIDSLFAKAYYNLGSIYAYHIKNEKKMKHYWGMFAQRFPRHEDAAFIKNEMKKMAHAQ